MASKREERKVVKNIALGAFSSMPTLYDTADKIRVYITRYCRSHVFDILYRSGRYSEATDDPDDEKFTAYSITMNLTKKEVTDENINVHPFYRHRGFARQMVDAKHNLLRRLDFEEVRLVDMLEDSEDFWTKHMGYEKRPDGSIVFDLRTP